MKTRLQKLMAEANVASRRAAEQLIEQGRVRLNGKIARLGDKADPETDLIEVDGDRLKFSKQPKKVYFALYKPKYVLTTTAPHRGDERKTVLDLIPYKDHLSTIGRLDADSEGLIVLTNDGDLTHRLTHPSYRHTKTYKVTVRGLPSEAVLQRWEEGIWLEDEGKTAPCLVTIVKGAPRETVLRIIMTEGKKRQIRRVAMALGHPVQRLVRTHIGMLSVEGLRPGEWRELTPHDVHELSTPSPAFKELRAKRQERRAASSANPRGEVRDTEYRPRRPLGDAPQNDERPHRPRFRSDEEKTSARERLRRRSSEGSPSRDKPHRPLGDAPQSDDRPHRPRFRSDDKQTSTGERLRRPRRGTETEKDESNRPQSPRRPSGSRGHDDAKRPARRSSGSRTRRDDERPTRRSSNTRRRPPSQSNRRSRQGRSDE